MFETPYKGLFAIKPCCTNGTVTFQCGLIQIRHNISRINPYKSSTKVEDINPENMLTSSHIFSGLISSTFVPYLYGLIPRILYLICIGPHCNVTVPLIQHGFIENGPLYGISNIFTQRYY